VVPSRNTGSLSTGGEGTCCHNQARTGFFRFDIGPKSLHYNLSNLLLLPLTLNQNRNLRIVASCFGSADVDAIVISTGTDPHIETSPIKEFSSKAFEFAPVNTVNIIEILIEIIYIPLVKESAILGLQ
jgi:hypothetical protein